ncbi:Uncharacterised protein [uncultured archaeon]|nr:Uncharacterised protein [uncultured archaeon]
MTGLQSLEEVLLEFVSLEEDFTGMGYRSYGGWTSNDKYGQYLVEPELVYLSIDPVKKENAQQRLQQIYNSSGWYFVKYKAAKILRINDDMISNQLENWLADLKIKLGATNEITEYNSPTAGGYDGSAQIWYDIPTSRASGIPLEKNLEVDSESKEKARKDLNELYQIVYPREERLKIARVLNIDEPNFLADEILRGSNLGRDELEKVYFGLNLNKEARLKAGNNLGYPGFNVWMNVNKEDITEIACSVTALGLVSGIGYGLYRYFSW